MKLISIHFVEAPKLPAVRPGTMTQLECFNPPEQMRGWRALIRGASILFVSPPGYKRNLASSARDPNGPCEIHEVPRVQCYIQWEGSPDEMSISKHDTPPFGPEAPKPAPKTEEKKPGLLDQVL